MPPQGKGKASIIPRSVINDTLKYKFQEECRRRMKINETPLFVATKSGYVDVVTQLLSAKADVNHQDANGQTALFYASHVLDFRTGKKKREIASMLLEHLADVGIADSLNGQTALFYAAKSDECITQLLLKMRSDSHHIDKYGQTALFYAAQSRYFKSSQLLLETRCDPNCKDKKFGRTALFNAMQSRFAIAQVSMLTRFRVDIEHKDDSGKDALRRAAETLSPAALKVVEAIFSAFKKTAFSEGSPSAECCIAETSSDDSVALAQVELAQRCFAAEHYLFHVIDKQYTPLSKWWRSLSCGNLSCYIKHGTVVLRLIALPSNLIGYVGFNVKGHCVHINQLLLCARVRHEGFGRELLSATLQYLSGHYACPESGWTLRLSCALVNPALAWYWRRGFRPIGASEDITLDEAVRASKRIHQKFMPMTCKARLHQFGPLKFPLTLVQNVPHGPTLTPLSASSEQMPSKDGKSNGSAEGPNGNTGGADEEHVHSLSVGPATPFEDSDREEEPDA